MTRRRKISGRLIDYFAPKNYARPGASLLDFASCGSLRGGLRLRSFASLRSPAPLRDDRLLRWLWSSRN